MKLKRNVPKIQKNELLKRVFFSYSPVPNVVQVGPCHVIVQKVLFTRPEKINKSLIKIYAGKTFRNNVCLSPLAFGSRRGHGNHQENAQELHLKMT
jgi:hypothetical protein